MHIKLKKRNDDGFLRLESAAKIKEVMIQEDFLHPNNESVALCFEGKNSSGILELSTKELEALYRQIKPYLHATTKKKL